MMVQKNQDFNPAWSPDYKSFVSEISFMAFSSGHSTYWSDGKMVYNNCQAIPDRVHFHELRRIYCDDTAPFWANEAISIVDDALPDDETILRSMDDFSLVLSSSPAVFRLPLSPYREELAKCILAARVLFRCREHMVFPVEYGEIDCIDDLTNASYLCSILGGEWTINLAAAWAADARSFLS